MTVNIVNTDAITRYLEAQTEHFQIAQWLNIALAKSLSRREESAVVLTAPPADAPQWLLNKWDVCGPFHEFVPDAALTDKVRHIKDWLISARHANEPFLQDLDDKGRPKKLVALDLDGAHNAADKYFARLNQKFRSVAEDDADTKTVMTFDDGSRIVQLLSTNALKVEGPKMGHCIGGGSYDQSLLDGSCKFYSLRDAKNEPHATFHVEVKGNILRQCKGKENKPPIQKYMPGVQKFCTQEKFDLQESAAHTGLICTDDGQYHSIYNLPQALSISGDLCLSNVKDLMTLPERLSVGGTLYLDGCTGLTALPKHLSVGGTLHLSYCTGLTALPDNLSVNKSINAIGCTGLTSLPKKFSVRGSLDLDGCTGLTALPDNLSIGQSLSLQDCSGLTALPANLSLEDLVLTHCTGLTSLPARLSVRRVLNLTGCTNLTSLPEDLSTCEDIYLTGCTGLTSLPKNLSVSRVLNLSGCTGLTALPEHLAIEGAVVIEGAAPPLPQDWTVKYLFCNQLDSASLTNNLTVTNKLYLFHCKMLSAISGYLTVGDYLSIDACDALASLPENLSVGGDFNLQYYDYSKALTSLPAGLSVKGNFYIRSAHGLTSLAPDLYVGGDLELHDCKALKSIPPTIKCGGKLITDIGTFETVTEACDAFDRYYGRKNGPAFVPNPRHTRSIPL